MPAPGDLSDHSCEDMRPAMTSSHRVTRQRAAMGGVTPDAIECLALLQRFAKSSRQAQMLWLPP